MCRAAADARRSRARRARAHGPDRGGPGRFGLLPHVRLLSPASPPDHRVRQRLRPVGRARDRRPRARRASGRRRSVRVPAARRAARPPRGDSRRPSPAARRRRVTGGRRGGGAAETLRATVPILAELGIDARWEITGGDTGYYATARALQAALEGAERGPSEEGLARWADMNRLNGKKLDLGADLISVHDSQPASLVSARNDGRWVWRCHVDCSGARADPWTSFRQFADQFDAAVFPLTGFESRLDIPMFVVPPSIDPFAERNRHLTPRRVTELLGGLGVARDKPLLVQIGPFARAHDPLGVVDAYRLVK